MATVLNGWSLERSVAEACEAARGDARRVDQEAMFPARAISELREHRLLGATDPFGRPWEYQSLAYVARELGKCCGSTALIWAIHHSQARSLLAHGRSRALRTFTQQASAQQFLVAGLTSEAGVDGDIGIGSSALRDTGRAIRIDKTVPVASFLASADAALITAVEQNREGIPITQRVALVRRDQWSLEPLGGWDGLGMRGTQSDAVRILAEIPPEQLLDTDYQTVASSVMTPTLYLLWSACWLGIAEGSTSFVGERLAEQASEDRLRAPGFARYEMAKREGYDRVIESVSALGSRVEREASRLDGVTQSRTSKRWDIGLIESLELRIDSSNRSIDAIVDLMRVSGLSSYRSSTPVGEHLNRALRDVLASIAVTNIFRASAPLEELRELRDRRSKNQHRNESA